MANFKRLPTQVYGEIEDSIPSSFTGYRRTLAKEILQKRKIRTTLSERQNHRCCYCRCLTNNIKDDPRQATIEHIVTVSRGGDNLPWEVNCVMACRACNNDRRNTELPEVEALVLGLIEAKASSARYSESSMSPNSTEREIDADD